MERALLRIGVVVSGLVVGASSATAQQQPFFESRACEGEISALAPGEIPVADAYSVDIFDPTEAALRFREIFLGALKEAAKATREDGNLVFSFRSESIFSGITSRNRVNPTYRAGDRPSRSSPRSTEDETRDLIRSDRRANRDTLTASQQILVEAELRNNVTQRVVWLATVRCNPLTNDSNSLMAFVSKIIVENVGVAIKQKAF